MSEFSREAEGTSTPKKLADEALKHIRKARRACGDSDEAIAHDEREVPRRVRRGKLPTFPDVRKLIQQPG